LDRWKQCGGIAATKRTERTKRGTQRPNLSRLDNSVERGKHLLTHSVLTKRHTKTDTQRETFRLTNGREEEKFLEEEEGNQAHKHTNFL